MSDKLRGSAGEEDLTKGFCFLWMHLHNTLDRAQGKQLDIRVYFRLHEIVNMLLGQTLHSFPPEENGNKLCVESYATLESSSSFQSHQQFLLI